MAQNGAMTVFNMGGIYGYYADNTRIHFRCKKCTEDSLVSVKMGMFQSVYEFYSELIHLTQLVDGLKLDQ